MMQLVTYFASAEVAEAAEDKGLFGALGIDWRMLLLQVLAFLVLLWVLNKFVYPHLIKAIDSREKAIAESVAAAANAEEQAEETQAKIEKLFKDAREESSQLIATAQKEAAQLVKNAEDKSRKRAERIVADAHSQIDRDIAKARQQLRAETVELVALATEKIVREKVDATRDAQLIERAIQEAGKV